MIHTFDEELKSLFGRKVWKLTLDAGRTCPNRDGTCGTGGCAFCAGGGRFAAAGDEPDEQLARARAVLGPKADGAGFLAYFQSGTNTYAPVDELRRSFWGVLARPEILGLCIGTRPDCLPDGVLALLEELARVKPVWVELGLQTASDEAAAAFGRGYATEVFDRAMEALAGTGVRRVVHVIAGLPDEPEDGALQTAAHAARFRPEGIKFHVLNVLRGTPMEERFRRGEVPVMSRERYVALVCDCIRRLPPETAIHRLTGDGDMRLLIVPAWAADKKRVLNAFAAALADVRQGEAWKGESAG
ncbi:MAG: TIGR01212 family radical SAM protein [Oscillospiraceae bacterium]|nr:TIGR01212 family radical SAM protein [Oscillospiraceae bacterium]